MRGGKLVLVSGAVRSGKSTFAEKLAKKSGCEVVYVATAQALDDEMQDRIRIHRDNRPAAWQTVEAPFVLEKVLWRHGGKPNRLLLIDCLTMWLSNILLQKVGFQGEKMSQVKTNPELRAAIMARVKNTAVLAAKLAAEVVVVTNEVGWGLVPDKPLARLFRDLSGAANQAFADRADRVYLLVAGLPQRLK